MNSFFSKENKGFTLIELIIVVSVLAGLTSYLVINGVRSRSEANLSRAVDIVESNLNYAQSIGMNGKPFPEDADHSNQKAFDKGYGVHFDKNTANNMHIIVYGGNGDINDDDDISADEDKYSGSTQDYKILNLPSGIIIDDIEVTNSGGNFVSKNWSDVLFRRGTAQAHIYANGVGFDNADKVKIKLSNGSSNKCVYVYKTGLIFSSDSC